MLLARVRVACAGVPCATVPTVPTLASSTQRPSAPIVPVGSKITHSALAIIASISAAWPSVSATRRRTSPL